MAGHVRDNTRNYAPSPLASGRSSLKYELFIGRVLSVDQERMVLTLEDIRDKTTYKEVAIFPSEHSSVEATVVQMPEQYSTCLAVNLVYGQGFSQIAILSWVANNVTKALDAIASRPLSGTVIQGESNRLRGVYRKAYPGQKTSSYTGGYSDKTDSGWDRTSSDLSRDRLDPERRQWTQIAGRKIGYSDAGLTMQGAVNRPTAANIPPVQLPDGTFAWVANLAPGSQPTDRYVSGKADVLPFTESTALIQEFALDYPLPAELLQTTLFDQLLGTTQQPWTRTTVGALTPSGETNNTTVKADNQTYLISQGWDHPFDTTQTAVGPTLNEGPTPQRKAFIMETSQGTLVGYNLFDQVTYGFVLKPVVFPYTQQGRFGTDVESGYLPVVDSTNHDEARLAASCMAVRFPYEYNTTRMDVTKEGFISLEVGATLPKENDMFGGGYEHPHGAGRSLEAHLVGSLKAVIGKNRDEEDAIDIQALGQSVIRLGADDTSLPNARRTVETQIRSKGDAVAARTLQYWTAPKLSPGDAGNLANKTGAENVSFRGAFDGSAILRLGARNPSALRRHLVNGYVDGPGKNPYAVGDPNRIDSRSAGRPTYGAGDSVYQFHDLTQVGTPLNGYPPYVWSGQPVTNMDQHGLSLDMHAVRDILLRIGANPASGQSLLIDLAGGSVVAMGKDNQGRSVTAALDGAIEMTIKPNAQQKAIRLSILGDIDITQVGNVNYQCTGSITTECTTLRHITKTDHVITAQKIIEAALTRHTTEAPDIVHNQGLYQSNENS